MSQATTSSSRPDHVIKLKLFPGDRLVCSRTQYVSPASGKPSQMLTAVTGGEKGVRFSDGCGGALAVDSSGLTVTALQITPQCTVRASLGNFTELQSPSFGITSRENAGD